MYTFFYSKPEKSTFFNIIQNEPTRTRKVWILNQNDELSTRNCCLSGPNPPEVRLPGEFETHLDRAKEFRAHFIAML